jgi:hypothetical protein
MKVTRVLSRIYRLVFFEYSLIPKGYKVDYETQSHIYGLIYTENELQLKVSG